jgi:hypothetical protein
MLVSNAMRRPSPLGSLVFGALAGAAGSLVQNLFFKATAKAAPKPPEGAFEPPEAEQRGEQPTETVARRVVEDLAARGPVDDETKKRGNAVVHYTFGSLWGAAYGLARESIPALETVPGALAWSTLVWAVSDNLILPTFRLGAWPQSYPLKNHVYALGAHVAYGVAVCNVYRLLRARPWLGALGALTVARQTRRLPPPLRAKARPILRRYETLKRELPALARELPALETT